MLFYKIVGLRGRDGIKFFKYSSSVYFFIYFFLAGNNATNFSFAGYMKTFVFLILSSGKKSV